MHWLYIPGFLTSWHGKWPLFHVSGGERNHGIYPAALASNPAMETELSTWKEKFGAYTMKRVAAGAHLPTPGIRNLRNAQTIEPTTAWTAVSFPSGSTMYSFLHLSGVGRALWANSGDNEHSQRTGPPSNAELISLPEGRTRWMAQASSEPGTSRSRVLRSARSARCWSHHIKRILLFYFCITVGEWPFLLIDFSTWHIKQCTVWVPCFQLVLVDSFMAITNS